MNDSATSKYFRAVLEMRAREMEYAEIAKRMDVKTVDQKKCIAKKPQISTLSKENDN